MWLTTLNLTTLTLKKYSPANESWNNEFFKKVTYVFLNYVAYS